MQRLEMLERSLNEETAKRRMAEKQLQFLRKELDDEELEAGTSPNKYK
jgi:hypothetical protein